MVLKIITMTDKEITQLAERIYNRMLWPAGGLGEYDKAIRKIGIEAIVEGFKAGYSQPVPASGGEVCRCSVPNTYVKYSGETWCYACKKQVKAASTIPSGSEAVDKFGFMEWAMSDENSFNKRYSSDDDNDGKWYDEFTEGVSRHYYTTESLYQLYLKQKVK